VEQFVREFGIPWPCGYGASLETIKDFGAYFAHRRITGWEINPTLYVIGADGRVRWCDQSGRLNHENCESLMRRLEAEIGKALAETAGRKGR
jgi:hypothetical protein